MPVHASLFTGLPPETHGANERWMWLDDRFLTMAEHFRTNGYATFTMAANTLLCDETNLVQGFDVKLNTYKGKVAKAAKAATREKLLPNDVSNELTPGWKPPSHGAHNAEWGRAVYKEAAPIVASTFLQWLGVRKTPERPFFAFLNLMEAHTPRLPSMASRKQVLADDPELIRPRPPDRRRPHQPPLLQLRQVRVHAAGAGGDHRGLRRRARRPRPGHGRPPRRARSSRNSSTTRSWC